MVNNRSGTMKEQYICEICDKQFESRSACKTHEYNCKRASTPPIAAEIYIREYEIYKADPEDYSKIKLVDLNSGTIYIEEAYSLLENTNINFISIDKLIGKKIRIISYVEIIN